MAFNIRKCALTDQIAWLECVPLSQCVLRLLAVIMIGLNLFGTTPAQSQSADPFAQLPGRWVGEGRLGFKSGDVENIKCRATYFLENDGRSL
ncbi:MAG: hypothetical protein K0U34_00300, partial [Alphaproteobacteria bacterium]|nr:hypothetical protein [Alphaproteobacteria bacterium]